MPSKLQYTISYSLDKLYHRGASCQHFFCCCCFSCQRPKSVSFRLSLPLCVTHNRNFTLGTRLNPWFMIHGCSTVQQLDFMSSAKAHFQDEACKWATHLSNYSIWHQTICSIYLASVFWPFLHLCCWIWTPNEKKLLSVWKTLKVWLISNSWN